jgi:hypothetical protein
MLTNRSHTHVLVDVSHCLSASEMSVTLLTIFILSIRFCIYLSIYSLLWWVPGTRRVRSSAAVILPDVMLGACGASCVLCSMCRYVLPGLSLVPNDADESVRVRFAAVIAGVASTAHRLLVVQQLQGQKPVKPGESAPPPVGRRSVCAGMLGHQGKAAHRGCRLLPCIGWPQSLKCKWGGDIGLWGSASFGTAAATQQLLLLSISPSSIQGGPPTPAHAPTAGQIRRGGARSAHGSRAGGDGAGGGGGVGARRPPRPAAPPPRPGRLPGAQVRDYIF